MAWTSYRLGEAGGTVLGVVEEMRVKRPGGAPTMLHQDGHKSSENSERDTRMQQKERKGEMAERQRMRRMVRG